VGLSDLEGFKSRISAGNQMGFGYYFPYLLARNGAEDFFLGQEEGSVCVFVRRDRPSGPHLDLFLAPAPINSKALRRCLERSNDHNGDYSARVLKIDEQDVAQLSGLRHLRIEKRREQYIYCPHSFRNISGNRFRTLRRNVAMVEALRDVEVVPFASKHVQGCLELLRRWSRQHSHEHNAAGGVGTSESVIKLAGLLPEPDLRGEVVFIDGKLSAFSFGGEIRPGLGCYVEAKSDFDIPGLSYFQRRHFLSGLTDFEFVNDSSSANRPGLKQLKDSMRPIAMHSEYIAHQQRPFVVRLLKHGVSSLTKVLPTSNQRRLMRATS
jgi:hypothetical protein